MGNLIGVNYMAVKDKDDTISCLISESYKKLVSYQEMILEYAMRFLIDKPIRGEVSIKKIRERNLRVEYYDTEITIGAEFKVDQFCVMFLYQGEKPINLNLQGKQKEHFSKWAKRKYKIDISKIPRPQG